MASQQVKRALIVTRQSRTRLVTEDDATAAMSGSLDAQEARCRDFCAAQGWEVVGVAKDANTSGAMSPFDRPEFAKWLTDHPQIDVVLGWRADRLSRSVIHLVDLIKWASEWGVTLRSVTESYFDTSTEVGQSIAVMISTFGAMELAAIRERTKASFETVYHGGRWRGGVAPWGYVPEQSERGWRLVQDPAQVSVILEVVKRVLAGEGLHPIAADLTRRGVPTAKDAFAIHQGKKPRGFSWHVSPLRRALRNEALRGWAVTKGEVVRDDSGAPLVRAKPVLDDSTWRRLQARLDATARKSNARKDQALLTGNIFCAVCGNPMWVLRGGGAGRIDRYRCRTANTVAPCGNRSIGMSVADAALFEALEQIWNRERTVRVRTPGYDSTDEIRDIDAALEDLANQVGSEAYRRAESYRTRIDARTLALTERREELVAQPVVEAGWVDEGTGETLREWWESATPESRNGWVRDSGFTMWVDMRTDDAQVVTVRTGAYGDDLTLWHQRAMAESSERAGMKGAKREVTKVMREIGKLGQDHLWMKFELA